MSVPGKPGAPTYADGRAIYYDRAFYGNNRGHILKHPPPTSRELLNSAGRARLRRFSLLVIQPPDVLPAALSPSSPSSQLPSSGSGWIASANPRQPFFNL